MGEGIVAIVAIGCGTGMVWMFFETVKTAITNRGSKRQDAMLEEIRALREEVQHLRRQNNDLILALDSAPPHLTRPVQPELEQPVTAGRR